MNVRYLLSKTAPPLVFFLLLFALAYAFTISSAQGHEGHQHDASQPAPQSTVNNGKSSLTAPAAQGGEWYCTMHPEVHQHEPGKCPICKMKLVKRSGK